MTRALGPFLSSVSDYRAMVLLSYPRTTSVSFSSPRPRPLPPLLPFISELCNFPLATVPPCRAEIGVRSNDFVEMYVVAEEGEGHDGDGGTSIASCDLAEEEQEEEENEGTYENERVEGERRELGEKR